MFLHVSVILFMEGGGLVSQYALQVVSQHALQVSRSTPRGEVEGSGLGGGLQAHTQWEVEGSGRGGLQAHTRGGLQVQNWGGLQAHTQGWGVSRHTSGGYPSMHCGRHHPNGYCCGRYASYWNAFLLYVTYRFIRNKLVDTTNLNFVNYIVAKS